MAPRQQQQQQEPSGLFSAQDLIFLGVSLALAVASYYFFFMRGNSGSDKGKTAERVPARQPIPQANPAPAAAVVDDRARAPRQRVNLMQRQQEQQAAAEEEKKANSDSDGDISDDDDGQDADPQARTQHQMQRDARRQERREQREAMQQYYDQRERKENQKRSKYEEKDRLRELEQLKREEEERKVQELQRIKEQEEFDNWKQFMEVEESGQAKVSAEEEEAYYKQLNDKIILYIKLRKVVVLEEMTGEFKMTTQEVIDRIKALELNKMLTGIIDERGKYIYITPKELESVKNYIVSKGRVPRSELITECNRLIKLDPSAEDKEKIMQEEKDLLLELNKEFDQIKQEQK